MDGTKLVQYIVRVLLIIAAVALIAMMVVITGNILGRVFFSAPILGAIEVGGLAGVILSAIAVGYVEKERRNVLVEILADKFPPRVRGFTDAFVLLLSLGAIGVMSYAMFTESFYAAGFGEETYVLEIPTAPFRFIWSIGLALLCVVLIANIVISIRRGVKR